MPQMDGNQMAASLRQRNYPAIIIMVTASRPSPTDSENLDAVLLKPASLEQLRTLLLRHCSSVPKTGAASTLSATVTSPLPSALSKPSILWLAFLEDYASTMDILETASKRSDKSQCLQQLHKLRGGLGILQEPLTKQVAALENRCKTTSVSKLLPAFRTLRQSLDRLIAANT